MENFYKKVPIVPSLSQHTTHIIDSILDLLNIQGNPKRLTTNLEKQAAESRFLKISFLFQSKIKKINNI